MCGWSVGWSRASQATVCGGCDGNQNGTTPTFAAAENGHVECIEALVRHGADVNQAMPVSVESIRAEMEAR